MNSEDPLADAKPTRTDLLLGAGNVAVSLLIAFVWIPLDVETGVFEKVRRRIEIGDAFAPALAAGLLALGGLLLVVQALRSRSFTRFSVSSFLYAVGLLAGFLLFHFLLMWTGPALVALFGSEAAEYRLLRDTIPWKYAGFVLAGCMLITGLIAFVERKLTVQSVAIGLIATFGLILLYDLPFDDLLLPPNGDF